MCSKLYLGLSTELWVDLNLTKHHSKLETSQSKFKLYKVRKAHLKANLKAHLKANLLFDSIYKRFVMTKSMKSRLLVARSQRWECLRRNVTVFS